MNIAKNTLKKILELNREKKEHQGLAKKRSSYKKKSVCVSISGRACCHERNMCNHWPRSAKKPVDTAKNEKA